MTCKFKPGDEVKIIGNSNSSCNRIGDIGIITEFDSYQDKVCRVVVTGRTGGGNLTFTKEIELFKINWRKHIE